MLRTRFSLLLVLEFYLGLVLCVLTSSALSGCASVSNTLIAPVITGPAMGEDATYELRFDRGGGREVDLFRDASDRPPTYSTNMSQAQTPGSSATFGGVAGIFRGFSLEGGLLGLSSGAFIDGFWVGGKYQLFGRQSVLVPSRLYITPFFRIGYQRGTTEGNKKGEFGPGGYAWNAERNGQFQNAGISIGYETVPHWIPFVGVGQGFARATADVKHEAAGSEAAANYHNGFEATLTTWSFGLQYTGERVRFSVSQQRTQTRSTSFQGIESQVGLELSFRISEPPEKPLAPPYTPES